MKRMLLVTLGVMLVGSSTGCCAIDRMFHCQRDCGGCCSTCCSGSCGLGGLFGGGGGGCSTCCQGGCSSCGGSGCNSCSSCNSCASCGSGSGGECANGMCEGYAQHGGHPRVTYRGGAALSHRLTGRGGNCGACEGCDVESGEPCDACGGRGCGRCGGCGLAHRRDDGAANAGYGGAQVAYPYYTTRGPRDFLACNPGGLSR